MVYFKKAFVYLVMSLFIFLLKGVTVFSSENNILDKTEKDKCSSYNIDPIYIQKLKFSEQYNNILKNWIGNFDTESFEMLNDVYAKDLYNVYLLKDENNIKTTKNNSRIEYSDPETFVDLCNGYAKDKNFVYYYGEHLKEADPYKIEYITDNFVKDQNFIYYKTFKLPEIDVNSVVILNSFYIKDKSAVYYLYKNIVKKIENADPDSFEVVILENELLDRNVTSYGVYAKDNNSFYYNNKPIDFIDPKSVKVLDEKYIKDSTSVYREFNKLNNADPNTFSIINEDFSKDKNQVFFRQYPIIGSDPSSFKIIDYIYSIDIYTLYKKQGNTFEKLKAPDLLFDVLKREYLNLDKKIVNEEIIKNGENFINLYFNQIKKSQFPSAYSMVFDIEKTDYKTYKKFIEYSSYNDISVNQIIYDNELNYTVRLSFTKDFENALCNLKIRLTPFNESFLIFNEDWSSCKMFGINNNEEDAIYLLQGKTNDGIINTEEKNMIKNVLERIQKKYPKIEDIKSRHESFNILHINFNNQNFIQDSNLLKKLNSIYIIRGRTGIKDLDKLNKKYQFKYIIYNPKGYFDIIFKNPMDIITLSTVYNETIPLIVASPTYDFQDVDNIYLKENDNYLYFIFKDSFGDCYSECEYYDYYYFTYNIKNNILTRETNISTVYGLWGIPDKLQIDSFENYEDLLNKTLDKKWWIRRYAFDVLFDYLKYPDLKNKEGVMYSKVRDISSMVGANKEEIYKMVLKGIFDSNDDVKEKTCERILDLYLNENYNIKSMIWNICIGNKTFRNSVSFNKSMCRYSNSNDDICKKFESIEYKKIEIIE